MEIEGKTIPLVTGHDGYILRLALGYAIITIGGLPETQREESNAQDMLALLRAMTNQPDFYLNNAQRHIDGVWVTENDAPSSSKGGSDE
jgi:hypothetical protein